MPVIKPKCNSMRWSFLDIRICILTSSDMFERISWTAPSTVVGQLFEGGDVWFCAANARVAQAQKATAPASGLENDKSMIKCSRYVTKNSWFRFLWSTLSLTLSTGLLFLKRQSYKSAPYWIGDKTSWKMEERGARGLQPTFANWRPVRVRR